LPKNDRYKGTTNDSLLWYNNMLFTALFTVQTRDEQEETNQKQSKVKPEQTVNTVSNEKGWMECRCAVVCNSETAMAGSDGCNKGITAVGTVVGFIRNL
jgi:hypothetical protein